MTIFIAFGTVYRKVIMQNFRVLRLSSQPSYIFVKLGNKYSPLREMNVGYAQGSLPVPLSFSSNFS